MSLWSPDIVPWFDHGYAALAQHFGQGNDKVYAIYLGIHGDFGETIFPMGWHPDEEKCFGEDGTGLPDFWCGDDYARANFQRFARSKYRTLRKLNATWGTQFKDFNQVTYPPAAAAATAGIPGTPQGRRYWLDFIEWYFGSMTRFTGEVCRMARHYFPQTLLELPVGGGSENVMYGQDTTALPKIARQYGVQIRSTHGGYTPFPQGYAAMIKRIATPCKVYGVPHWLEPPGQITPEGEVSRIMEALSCGNLGFWDWGQNPVNAANVFREYTNYLTRESPLVDVALFFPTTAHRLCPSNSFPPRLEAVGAHLRDVMDFDLLDEELIADDALRLYRVLVWVEGNCVEEQTLKAFAAWINKGGVLVWWGTDAPQTVEGRTSLSSALLGLTQQGSWQAGGPLEIQHLAFLRHLTAHLGNRAGATVSDVHQSAVVLGTVENRPAIWAMPHRKGWVIAAAGLDQATFNELVRDAAYNLSRLDSTKTDAPEVDTDYDGVYTTLLANGEVILHNFNSEARTTSVGGATAILPPKSLRSILLKPANPSGR
jgi:enamine deaminase RidA (YjgF/YER057c/UK114 family)